MAAITDYPLAVIVVGALVMLLAGYLLGYRKAKRDIAGEAGRGRLDRLPTPPSAPAPAAPAFRANGPAMLAPDALARIQDALRGGNKIQAIKILREETGLGLAEAKHAVESLER